MSLRPKPAGSVEIDPGCVKTLRGMTAPGILGSRVTRRGKKRKNLSSARHYDQIRFRFHTAKTRSDVLVVGAGPTGLVLALWLTKLGVKPRIIDKTAAPGTTSRALAVHARTLELYRQLDLADYVLEHGHKVPAVRLWVKGEPRARIDFAAIASDLTPYAFLQIFPQDEHERLLIARLEELGVAVERQTELLNYHDEGDRIGVRLRRSDGRQESCEADYIAGCDGAHSIVRETMS